ncbi:cation transporter, putative [Entamoeba nuttalli P19]|uniref:Cation transporter, putative n=1 Tax=Entamoeba nuttalli (strain P19) TaxID=1076696 RepID=K2H766_ENTNP|nr:cation transporter, putative [Entamoeba nuttalli P19]EKE38359.1 cation transporter, putative [Entamoeba nuttalli P19]|eukprot:XP_008859308.1 cation transporter, putative [Entamoeba nuttalli P19]
MPTFAVEEQSSFFSNLKNVVLATRKDKINIVYFVVLMVFALRELMVSVDTNSLGLLVSTVHTAFCLFSIIIYYAGKMYAHRSSTESMTYGFQRVEPLLGFINGFFLVLFSAFTLMQCVERMIEPVAIATEPDSIRSIISTVCWGLLINGIGLCFFSDIIFVREASSTTSSIPQSQKRFVLFHFIQNITVITIYSISFWYPSGIISYDGLFSMAMAFIVIYIAIPILTANGMILLQTSPQTVYPQIYAKLQQLQQLDGVLEYKNEHFWTLSPNNFVGSVVVVINEDADEQTILKQAHELFDSVLKDICIQVQKHN